MILSLPPVSSAVVKNEWSRASAPPICLYGYQIDNSTYAAVRYVLSFFFFNTLKESCSMCRVFVASFLIFGPNFHDFIVYGGA